ncbi:hypothetical protein OG762_18850 [Streptomyces sp. NBC_01136]|uniref:hypothetical protein n=1 Tax=unclassified Streptomyces TaxID=2593676 RepID=UPI00324F42C2|nr:hypothetical protein OG762_18850 [Streptomyces sp. NBC_01136]
MDMPPEQTGSSPAASPDSAHRSHHARPPERVADAYVMTFPHLGTAASSPSGFLCSAMTTPLEISTVDFRFNEHPPSSREKSS